MHELCFEQALLLDRKWDHMLPEKCDLPEDFKNVIPQLNTSGMVIEPEYKRMVDV